MPNDSPNDFGKSFGPEWMGVFPQCATTANSVSGGVDRTQNIHTLIEEPGLTTMGWLWLVGSIKSYVSFAKETYKRDDILQKRPIILDLPNDLPNGSTGHNT